MPYVNRAGQFCGFIDYEDKPLSTHFVRRFFLLDKQNSRFEYFMDSPQNLPPGTAPLGVFNMKFLSLVADASKSRGKIPCCFYAVFSGAKHFFRADDQAERDEWISVLNEAAKVTVTISPSAKQTATVEPYRADIIGGVLHKTKLNTETNDASSSDDSVSAEKHVLPVHSLHTIHAGYCIKQGGRRKNWLKRYFTLTPDGLLYYKTAQDTAVLNQIPRGDIVEARMSVGVFTNKDHVFEVVTPYRVFYIQAESQVEREAWVDHINALVTSCKPLPAYAGREEEQTPRVRAMTQPSMINRTGSPYAKMISNVSSRNSTALRGGQANLALSPNSGSQLSVASAKKPLSASMSYGGGIKSSAKYNDVDRGTNGSYRPLESYTPSSSVRQPQLVGTPLNMPSGSAFKRIEGSMVVEPPYGNAGSSYWPYNERKLSVPNLNAAANSSSRTPQQTTPARGGQVPMVAEVPSAAATPVRGYSNAYRTVDTLSMAELRTLPDATRDFQQLNSEAMVPMSAVRISRVEGDFFDPQSLQLPQFPSPSQPSGWRSNNGNNVPVDNSQMGNTIAREAPPPQPLSVRRASENMQQSHNWIGSGSGLHVTSVRGQTDGRPLSRHESLMKRNDRSIDARGQPLSGQFHSQLQPRQFDAQLNRNPNSLTPMQQQATIEQYSNGNAYNYQRPVASSEQALFPQQPSVRPPLLTTRQLSIQQSGNLARHHSVRETAQTHQQQPTYSTTEATLPSSRSAIV